MPVPHKYSLIVLISIAALILSACGAASNETVIATSVAMTLQAEHTQQAAQATPTTQALDTATPPVAVASLAPVTTKAPPTAPSGSNLCTASAAFVSETIPDGTIESPGATFSKSWHIKNTGTCPWNNTWQFIYTSGDLMGGAVYQQLPGVVLPGDVMNIQIALVAPSTGGSYRGYWKIKSPWGFVFGDEGSGSAFWVDIKVASGTPENNKTQTAYGITNVTYDVSKTCTSANTFYTITAHISSNGPLTAVFTWAQSDGNNQPNNKITFAAATTKDVDHQWSQRVTSSQNERWVQVIITDPVYQEYAKVTLPPLCP